MPEIQIFEGSPGGFGLTDSSQRKVIIGIVAPGHFKRLGAQFGFLRAMFEENKKNNFPKPDFMTGVSAGAVAIACAAQDTEEDLVRTDKTLEDLRGKNFYDINPELKIFGGLLSLISLGVLLPINKIKKVLYRYGFTTAAIAIALLIEEKFIEKLLKCNSIFSNRNLYKLLRAKLNYRRIFSSPIKIVIAAANVNTKSYSIVTNFRPEHQDEHVFTQGIVDSTNLPVFFGFRENEQGQFIADGAAISNEPRHLAREFGCDVIIVLRFKCNDEDVTEKKYNLWVTGLQRFIDILVDEVARKTRRTYEFFNNDLREKKKISQAADTIENCLKSLPDSENTQKIRVAVDILRGIKLSCDGKREIKFIEINDEIPEFHFTDFKKNQMSRTIKIGHQAFHNAKEAILKAIEEVRRSKNMGDPA